MSVYDVPVLIIIFNRPDHAKELLKVISKRQPKKLYIASDGARKGYVEEKEVVESTRNDVLHMINWDCEVKTLFRDDNLGCNRSVVSAVNWLFENEETGVILEDDCIPNESFFDFCKAMLEKYSNDTRVVGINGNILFPENKDEIFFTRIPSAWGWATWRRAWSLNDYDIRENILNKRERFADFFSIKRGFYSIKYTPESGMYDFNTEWFWDQRWNYCTLLNNGLFVNPKKNLITNIGIQGTHTGSFSKFTHRQAQNIDVNKLGVPDYMYADYEYEVKVFNEYMPVSFGLKRLFIHVLGIMGMYNLVLDLYHNIKSCFKVRP